MINNVILILLVIIIAFFTSSIISFFFFKFFSINFKENLYLIIPILCIGIWALYFLWTRNFILNDLYQEDFMIFYLSGKQILKDPSKLYTYDYEGYDVGYVYLPGFAMFFSITFSLLPRFIAPYFFFLFSYIVAIFFTREYDKILILLGLKEKKYRFLFLIIISNGSVVFFQFLLNQAKYTIGFILFFILRRELQYNMENIKKNVKFYLVNYGLFVFIISTGPYLLFLLLIYLFHDISRSELFEKENIKKYCIAFLMIFVQNILFVIYPRLIFDYMKIFLKWNEFSVKHFYLRDLRKKFIPISDSVQEGIAFTLNIIMYTVILIIFLNTKLKIEEKFAFFSLCLILFWRLVIRILLFLFPLTMLLFIPFLNQDEKGIGFLKKNKLVLIGLIAVFVIFYWPTTTYMFAFYPGWEYSIFAIFFYLKYLIFISIFVSVLLLLYYKKYISNNALN